MSRGWPYDGERPGRHRRAEVGSADADVDDVGDPLVGANAVGERGHAIEHRVHLVDDVDAVELDHRTGRCPQRRVQHGAMFGDVDRLTGEHRVAAALDAGRAGHVDEGGEHGVVDGVLRVVDAQIADLDHVPLGATRVAVEQLDERTRDRVAR